jgi:hypothetical protein
MSNKYIETNSNIFMIKKSFEVFLLRKNASKFSPDMDLKTRFLIERSSRRIKNN